MRFFERPIRYARRSYAEGKKIGWRTDSRHCGVLCGMAFVADGSLTRERTPFLFSVQLRSSAVWRAACARTVLGPEREERRRRLMSNPSTVGRPMEILLVEDSLVDARLTIGALEHGGFRHRLTLVRDGAKRWSSSSIAASSPRRRARPHLLDLMLPRKSGLEVLNEVKSRPGLKDIPVVVMTASAGRGGQAAVRFPQGRRVRHQARQPGKISRPRADAEEVLAG